MRPFILCMRPISQSVKSTIWIPWQEGIYCFRKCSMSKQARERASKQVSRTLLLFLITIIVLIGVGLVLILRVLLLLALFQTLCRIPHQQQNLTSRGLRMIEAGVRAGMADYDYRTWAWQATLGEGTNLNDILMCSLYFEGI